MIEETAANAKSKLQKIIEYYKRSVKDDDDINATRDIVIKNYRLHVVTNSENEIDDEIKDLYNLKAPPSG